MSEIIITTISKTEIQQLVEIAVTKAIDKKSTINQKDQDAFLGVEEAASYLGIAKATLYGKCSKLLVHILNKERNSISANPSFPNTCKAVNERPCRISKIKSIHNYQKKASK